MIIANGPLEPSKTHTEEMVVGVLLVLEGETTIADVVQVLEPLEVGHGHTTSVHVQILHKSTRYSKIYSVQILIFYGNSLLSFNPSSLKCTHSMI